MPPWSGRACARLLSLLLALQLALGPSLGPGPSPASGRPTPLAGTPGPGRAPASLANLLRVENTERAGLEEDLHASLGGTPTAPQRKHTKLPSASPPAVSGSSGQVDRLLELQQRVLLEVRSTTYAQASTLDGRIAAFQDFVFAQAERQGVRVTERPLRLAEFNAREIRFVLNPYKTAGFPWWKKLIAYVLPSPERFKSLLQWVVQIEVPTVLPKFNARDGTLMEAVYSPTGVVYPTALLFPGLLVLWALVALGPLEAGALGSVLIPGGFAVWVWATSLPSEGHELTHIYQDALLERIRQELQIPLSPKAFYDQVTTMAFEKGFRRLDRDPPSPEHLAEIVERLFHEVRQRGPALPQPPAAPAAPRAGLEESAPQHVPAGPGTELAVQSPEAKSILEGRPWLDWIAGKMGNEATFKDRQQLFSFIMSLLWEDQGRPEPTQSHASRPVLTRSDLNLPLTGLPDREGMERILRELKPHWNETWAGPLECWFAEATLRSHHMDVLQVKLDQLERLPEAFQRDVLLHLVMLLSVHLRTLNHEAEQIGNRLGVFDNEILTGNPEADESTNFVRKGIMIRFLELSLKKMQEDPAYFGQEIPQREFRPGRSRLTRKDLYSWVLESARDPNIYYDPKRLQPGRFSVAQGQTLPAYRRILMERIGQLPADGRTKLVEWLKEIQTMDWATKQVHTPWLVASSQSDFHPLNLPDGVDFETASGRFPNRIFNAYLVEPTERRAEYDTLDNQEFHRRLFADDILWLSRSEVRFEDSSRPYQRVAPDGPAAPAPSDVEGSRVAPHAGLEEPAPLDTTRMPRDIEVTVREHPIMHRPYVTLYDTAPVHRSKTLVASEGQRRTAATILEALKMATRAVTLRPTDTAGPGIYQQGPLIGVIKGLTAVRAKPGERFLDLGGGDGRMAFVAAGLFGMAAEGRELNTYRVRRSHAAQRFLERQGLFSRRQVALRYGDFLGVDWRPFDVLYYVSLGAGDAAFDRLVTKALRELKPGARLLVFGLRGGIFQDCRPLIMSPQFRFKRYPELRLWVFTRRGAPVRPGRSAAPQPPARRAGLEEPAPPAGEALDANAILARADDHQRMSRQQAVGSLAQIRRQDRRRHVPGERGHVNQRLYEEVFSVVEAPAGHVPEALREQALNHLEEVAFVGDGETIARLQRLVARADFGARLRGAVAKALLRLETNVAKATKGRTMRVELTNTKLNASLQELIRALDLRAFHVALAEDSPKDRVTSIDFAEYSLTENKYIVYRAEQRGDDVYVYRKDAQMIGDRREGERPYPNSKIRLIDIRGNSTEFIPMEEFERTYHHDVPPSNQGIFAHTHVTFDIMPATPDRQPTQFMGHIFELEGTLSIQLIELQGVRLVRLFDEVRPSHFEERQPEYPTAYRFRGFDPIKIVPYTESRVAHPISQADEGFLADKGIRYSVEPESAQRAMTVSPSTAAHRVSGIGAFVGGLGLPTYHEYLLSGTVNVRDGRVTALALRVDAGDEEGVMDRRVMGLAPESDLANMALGEWFVFDPDGHTITFVRLDDYDGKQNMIHALTIARAGLEETVARVVAVVEAAHQSSAGPHVVIVDAAAPRTPQLAALLAALQHSPTIGPHLLMFDARYPMDEQLAAPLLAMSWKTSSSPGTVMFLSGDGRRAMQMERFLKTLFGSAPPFLQLRGILTVANLLIGLDVPPSIARQLEDELAARLEQREAVESGA